MMKWTVDGEPLNILKSKSETFLGLGEDDITTIMDLFARVRVAKATFHMPDGLAPGETTEFVSDFLQSTTAMMMGRIPVDEDVYDTEDEGDEIWQDSVDSGCEWALGCEGACIARDKLDRMTNKGTGYLSYREWYNFIDIWHPEFELLYDKKLKDERDWRKQYVKERLLEVIHIPYV